ncbi:Pol [Symbiodinium sp. CCMP2592]|nr:Pol [Symbiodinium sp. CCMP2592]
MVLAAAESMEQYAYLPARQAADALDRAYAHCDDVRAARKASGTTIWTRKAGARPDTCRGGLTLSLDLERTFDSVPWATLEECLVEFGVPADLISLILFLHEHARYTFTLSGETVSVEPQQGTRQGCGMSPTIWTLFSLHLAKKLQLVAPSSLRTYFADDLLLQWEFLGELAFRCIPQEIAAVLTLLRREGMCISVNKTVILRSWWGSRVHDVTRPFLTKLQHKRYFRVALDSGEEIRLPLVDSHKYLGMFLSYKNYEALSLKYRVQQSWVAFNRLTKALKNRSLPVRLRLRLYNSVCLATATYGLTSIGLSAEGQAKFRATVIRQLRMVVGDHSHVTGHTNVEVLGKYGIDDPMLQVDERTRQRVDKARTNQFLPYSDAVARRWSRLVDAPLTPELEQPPMVLRHTEQAPVTCEICHVAELVHRKGRAHYCPICGIWVTQTLSELEVGRKDMDQWNELMEGLPKSFTESAQKRERDEPREEEEPSRATRAPKTNKGDKGGKGRGNQPKVNRDTNEKTEKTEETTTTPKDLKSIVRMLTTVVIRQEDQLQLFRQDSAYILFMETSAPLAILPQLYALGQTWSEKKAKDPASPGLPLRVVLLGCLLKQIELRIEKLGTDEELRKVAKESKLLSEADCFNYLEYDAKAKSYQVKEGRLAIPRKDALQLVRELQEFILIPRVVHRFHASRKHTAEVLHSLNTCRRYGFIV